MKTTGVTYTLADRGYFDLLGSVAEEFDRNGIRYALVGGTGIQARISDIICRAKKGDIQNSGLELLLRGTKDFDIAADSSEEEFVRFFNEFQASNPSITLGTQGKRKQRQMLCNNGKTSMEVFLNYEVGPQDFMGLDESFYEDCINQADSLRLRNGNRAVSICVAKPEHLITSKLTRYDAKDIFDIGNLLKAMQTYKQFAGKLDSHAIKGYLEKAGKGELYGRLAEISQILK